MSELKQIFADGVSQVHFVNGMARIDLFRMEPQGEGKEPLQEPFARLILTPQVFLSTLDAMDQLAEKLTEAGVFQKK